MSAGDTILDKVPVPTPDVSAEVVGDEVLLYHPGRTEALYLNPTGGVIWGLCDGQRSVREIIAIVEAGYAEDVSDLAGDVTTTLAELRGHGVLAFR